VRRKKGEKVEKKKRRQFRRKNLRQGLSDTHQGKKSHRKDEKRSKKISLKKAA